jgi:hypothetical protein
MVKVKKTPLRMCIACHEMKPKKEMLRIVKNKEGEISLDTTGKKSGRGAYICDNLECIKKLEKSKLINRTFSCEVSKEVYQKVEEEFLGSKK